VARRALHRACQSRRDVSKVATGGCLSSCTVGEDVGHALEGAVAPRQRIPGFSSVRIKPAWENPGSQDCTPRPLPLAVSAGALLTARAMELLPPPPRVKGRIGPENEHAPEDRYDPAVPGVTGEREGFTRSSLD
jgi:hypothetical protein